MLVTSKSILLSRTVWCALIGAVIAILNATGLHIVNAPIDQIADAIMCVMAMIFRVTATQEVHIVAPTVNAP